MFVLGADLGQAQDPTAIAVGQVVGEELHLRHLERLALGTLYPRIVERIAALVGVLPGVTVVIDATGVGRAVLDQMREKGLEPVPVVITGGKSIPLRRQCLESAQAQPDPAAGSRAGGRAP